MHAADGVHREGMLRLQHNVMNIADERSMAPFGYIHDYIESAKHYIRQQGVPVGTRCKMTACSKALQQCIPNLHGLRVTQLMFTSSSAVFYFTCESVRKVEVRFAANSKCLSLNAYMHMVAIYSGTLIVSR